MKKIIILSILILSTDAIFSQNEVWNFLDKGTYNVGFKYFSLYDSSRTIHNPEGYRPVQVSIWYPAEISDAESMIYKDYFLLSAQEKNFNISDAYKDSAIIKYKSLLAQNGISDKAANEWFNTTMLAVKDAKPKTGKYPLVVVAQGNFHSAHHQSFLCEFLASNGYVVVTTPSQTRISGLLTDASQAVESADEQVKDMKFAINSIRYFKMLILKHCFIGT